MNNAGRGHGEKAVIMPATESDTDSRLDNEPTRTENHQSGMHAKHNNTEWGWTSDAFSRRSDDCGDSWTRIRTSIRKRDEGKPDHPTQRTRLKTRTKTNTR
jgi:hypothetical protein